MTEEIFHGVLLGAGFTISIFILAIEGHTRTKEESKRITKKRLNKEAA